MRAARLHGPGDIRLHDELEPVPSTDEVLLQVNAVGLCGSDRHWFVDGAIGGTAATEPLVLGHEIAATIADGPEAGTRVVVEPAIPCEACPTCRSGRPELCPTAGFAGYRGTDGGLQTRMTWPRRLLRPIPESIDDDEAAVLEALGIAVHAVHLAEIGPAARVAVVGSGPIGLLVIRTLRAAGVGAITAMEPIAHRAAAAVAAGAVLADDLDERLEGNFDVVFECAGEDDAVATAARLVAPGGRIVLVGIPSPDRTTITASVARRKGLTLVWCRRMRPADLDTAIELVASRRVEVGSLISHRFGLEAVGAAFDALADRRGLKIVVRPDGRA